MEFIKDIGTSLYMGGFILVGKGDPILVLRPGVELYPGDVGNNEVWISHSTELQLVYPTSDEFKRIVRQMDIQEVEISEGEGSKMIVRKTQRASDERVTWEVYKRDGYQCRYCGLYGGEGGATLSYDHVKLWEDGGEWTVENGVTACRNCNKQRGNTDYEEWIKGPIYTRKSINLSDEVIEANLELISKYKTFPTRISKRRR